MIFFTVIFSKFCKKSDVFYKKAVFKNLAILTRKHLPWSLFFNNGATLKKRLQHMCSPVDIANI